MTDSPINPSSAARPWDLGRWIALGLLVCTGVAFWPISRWLAQEIAGSQQIRQSFVMLGAATGLVIWQHLGEWRLVSNDNQTSTPHCLIIEGYRA